MIVRGATRDDLAAIESIERDCFPHDALPLITFVQYLELFGGTFLVAESEGRPVGFAIAGTSALTPGEAWLLDIAVAADARRQGVAQKLTTALLERLGDRTIRATVSPGNASSAALLARNGFVVERRVADYFGPGEARDIVIRRR